jgi:hypothetical protein
LSTITTTAQRAAAVLREALRGRRVALGRLVKGMEEALRPDLDSYTTEWRINPLLYAGLRHDAGQLPQGSSDLSGEKITENVHSNKINERREVPGAEMGGRATKQPPSRAEGGSPLTTRGGGDQKRSFFFASAPPAKTYTPDSEAFL